MAVTDPVTPEPRRSSIWLPRPFSIALIALILIVTAVASRVGFQMYRRHAAVRRFREMEAIRETYSRGPQWLRSWLSDDWVERFDNQFDEIVHLDFSNSEANDDDLAALTALPRLRTLTLSGTAITDSGLRHLSGVPELVILYLDGTQISDAGLYQLDRLQKLRVLSLAGTRITDAGLASLSRLPLLEDLALDATAVTTTGMSSLEHLRALRILSLNSTGVTDAGLTCLAGLLNLEELSLINTCVTDAGLPYLAKIANLRDLYLDGTRVSDLGLVHLAETTRLTYVSPLHSKLPSATDWGASRRRQVRKSRWPRGVPKIHSTFSILEATLTGEKRQRVVGMRGVTT